MAPQTASAAADGGNGTGASSDRNSRVEGIDSDESLAPNILWYIHVILEQLLRNALLLRTMPFSFHSCFHNTPILKVYTPRI
jgi:hypothetical protein